MCKECKAITPEQITNQIYDTIMENVGVSKHHVKFDHSRLKTQWVDGKKGEITLEFKNGLNLTLKITSN